MKLFLKKQKGERGFTLVELIVVVPLVAIIFLISYNLLFLFIKSNDYVNKSFNTTEDVRLFLNTIQKEASQAKKAVEDENIGPFYRKSANEIYIYTDVNEEKPELIRYRLEEDKLLRDVKKASNNSYPYEFKGNFIDGKVVLWNINNKGNNTLFGEVEKINKKKSDHEGEDYRAKVKLTIEISTGENNTPIKIDTYLMSKSRAKFE